MTAAQQSGKLVLSSQSLMSAVMLGAAAEHLSPIAEQYSYWAVCVLVACQTLSVQC